jgi:hypothetical protein
MTEQILTHDSPDTLYRTEFEVALANDHVIRKSLDIWRCFRQHKRNIMRSNITSSHICCMRVRYWGACNPPFRFVPCAKKLKRAW